MDDGLSHNLVHTVAQGEDGLIWLGTWEGVALFNGRDFTVYDRQNTPGVELDGVFVVVRDNTGGMLFGTAFDGVYHDQDGHWQQLGDASARHLAVSALLRRADGALWVGTPQTLYRIKGDGRVVAVGGLAAKRFTGRGQPGHRTGAAVVAPGQSDRSGYPRQIGRAHV